MTNQNNTVETPISALEAAAKQVLGLKKWASDRDAKAVAWARKKANGVLRHFTEVEVRGTILPLVDEMERAALIQELVQSKCDDTGVAELEKQVNKDDWEFESFQSYLSAAEATANRVADKDTFLEQAPGVNRATIDNRRYYQRLVSDTILHMEGMHDQFELGLMPRELVRDRLLAYYKKASGLVSRVKWVKRPDGGVNGYIRGCGMSVTGLRALGNTALSLLEEMGYRIPDKQWLTNSKKAIVIHEFTENRERQEMTQEDWNEHSARLFYQMIG